MGADLQQRRRDCLGGAVRFGVTLTHRQFADEAEVPTTPGERQLNLTVLLDGGVVSGNATFPRTATITPSARFAIVTPSARFAVVAAHDTVVETSWLTS